jgi:hypothetical protein
VLILKHACENEHHLSNELSVRWKRLGEQKNIPRIFLGFEPMPISRVYRIFLYRLVNIYVSGEFSDLNLTLKFERKRDWLADARKLDVWILKFNLLNRVSRLKFSSLSCDNKTRK